MRTEVERRPALLLVIGLTVGLTAPVYLFNLIVVAVGVVWLRSMPARIWLAAGFSLGAFFAPPIPLRGIVDPVPVSGTFTVSSVPTLRVSGGSSFLVFDGARRFEVLSDRLVPVLGDELRLSGTAGPLPSAFAKSYLARGVEGVIDDPPANVTVSAHSRGFAAWGSAWRSSFIQFASRRMTRQDAAVVEALAFDVRTGLPLETRNALEQSGTEHVLAASGLHLLTLAWFLEFVLARLPFPYLVRRTFILGLLLLYSFAAGLHPGTFRAAVSSALRDGAVLTGHEYDGLSALAIAGVIYLAWQPASVYDAGFQMSMVLGAGLAVFRANTAGMRYWPRLCRGSLAGWLVSVPIVAHLFGLVSLVSIPANLLGMALLPICLLGMLGAHALSFLSSGIADILLTPALLSAHLLQEGVRFFGLSPVWGIRVPSFSGYWLLPVYLTALGLWKPRARPPT